MKKRITALLLALCSLLTLTCCGGRSNYSTDKLNVWIWDESQRKALEELARPWAERKRVEVNIVVRDPSTYWQELRRGVLPDLMWMDDEHLAAFAGGGSILALDEALSGRKKLGAKEFSQVTRQALSYEGACYALPICTQTVALWYNKALFDSMSISYPDESWTWVQVANTAARLTNRNSGVYGIVLPCGDRFAWYQIVYAAGGTVVRTDEEGAAVSGWQDEGTIAAMDLIAEMASNAMPSQLIMSQAGATELFANGDAAMILQNRTQGQALERRNVGGQWACTLLPYWDQDGNGECSQGERVCLAGAVGWAVSADSTDADAALDLLEVLGGTQARKTLSEQAAVQTAQPTQTVTQAATEAAAETTDAGDAEVPADGDAVTPTEAETRTEPQPETSGEGEPAGPLDAYDRMETEAVVLVRPHQHSGEDWEDYAEDTALYAAWYDPRRMNTALAQLHSYAQHQIDGRKSAEDGQEK